MKIEFRHQVWYNATGRQESDVAIINGNILVDVDEFGTLWNFFVFCCGIRAQELAGQQMTLKEYLEMEI